MAFRCFFANLRAWENSLALGRRAICSAYRLESSRARGVLGKNGETQGSEEYEGGINRPQAGGG